MECPLQELTKKVPREFELVSQKKGFKRFMSAELRELLKQRAEILEARETAMANILQVWQPDFHCHLTAKTADNLLGISHIPGSWHELHSDSLWTEPHLKPNKHCRPGIPTVLLLSFLLLRGGFD